MGRSASNDRVRGDSDEPVRERKRTMIALVLASLSLFAQAFDGSWTCTGGYPWHIAPAPGSGWTVVQWGPRTAAGGTAYVGYVPKQNQWIYEDFHGDGSYATNTSPGPVDGAWPWTGIYFTGSDTDHGTVIWQRTSAKRIDRTFKVSVNGKPRQAHDSCRPK
jgi:hypothetical protein